MNNLIKECKCYNPYTAITKDLKSFEIDNIIIYNENGALIETGRGWFDTDYSTNNHIEALAITPDIIKKNKINFNCKDNYIIKSEQQSYYPNTRYTLYLYYKNVNYKYLGLKLDNCFLYIQFTILDHTASMVIGNRNTKSDKIKYSNDLKEAYKNIDSYNFDSHFNEIEKAIETIRKYHNSYIKQKEIENNYTIDNCNEIIHENYIDLLNNNKSLQGA